MKKFIYTIIGVLIVLYAVNVYATKVISPPPDPKLSVETYNYLYKLYQNLHKLEVVTTNPDGATTGAYGEMKVLYTGGNYYLEICTSSGGGKVWKGILLSNTP